MKKAHRRRIAAALACALLLAGCKAGATSSAGTLPSQPPAAISDASILADGNLRCLYSSETSPATIFCGDMPIYEAHPNGQAYLLIDQYTGEANYFVSATPESETDTPYHYRLHDKTGAVVFDCMARTPSSLYNNWLMLRTPDYSFDMMISTDISLHHLTSGRTIHLEDGMNPPERLNDELCIMTQLILAAPEIDSDYWYATHFYDNNMQHLYTLDGYICSAGNPFEHWIHAYDNVHNTYLYNYNTHELQEGLQHLSTAGYAVMQTSESYQLWDLQTDTITMERPASGAWQFTFSFGGNLVIDNNIYWADGTVTKDVAIEGIYDSDNVIALLKNNHLSLYDTTAQFLWETDLQLPESDDSFFSVSFLPGSKVMLRAYYSQDDGHTLCQIYDANGLVWESAEYSFLSHYDGCEYIFCSRQLANGSYVEDVRSLDGTLLISGIKDGAHSCEPDFFSCRRGFEEGWMDLNGNWLYSRTIWQNTADDAQPEWW